MKTVTIPERTTTLSPLLSIDFFPWYIDGLKQTTDVTISCDKKALYVHALCSDIHPSALCFEPNGSVYLDSCFEFFFAPFDDQRYFNVEINCIGTCYFAFGDQQVSKRKEIDPQRMKALNIITSIKESFWEVSFEVPYALLLDLSGEKEISATWKGNFYRCGGKVEPQYAVWNPINAPSPQYHLPEFFGTLNFVVRPSTA